ncbi:MAG: XylR family transcriptional regulator, partial [Verrucomicrobia bacterium]|nr:XylR family transcriptional regulator [Verrucomicrobiota bacterium]
MSQYRPTERSVALLIETSNRYSRELLHGIRAYMRENGTWAVHLTEQGRGDVPPPWLRGWEGHGIIARIENKRIESAAREPGVPVVSVSASGLAKDVPTVISDSAEVARLAAEHLIERGFRHFGYCGDACFAWSADHGRNFASHLEQQGFRCHFFVSQKEDTSNWQAEQRRIGNWLKTLPKPVGVMTCYDIRGQQVLDVCRHTGLQVPDEVGVIGQHDDTLLCELCDPPLSSVIPNPRQAGYHAATLLDQMMDGRMVEAKVYPIARLGVTTR